jgi:AMP-binding enzyme C-terminal domain
MCLKCKCNGFLTSLGNLTHISMLNTILLIFSAVVAGPDEKWGEHPVAFVVPKHGRTVTAGKVISFCRSRLAGFKVSRRRGGQDSHRPCVICYGWSNASIPHP